MAPPNKGKGQDSNTADVNDTKPGAADILVGGLESLQKSINKLDETVARQNEFSEKATIAKKEQLSTRSTSSTTQSTQNNQTQASISQSFKQSLSPKNKKSKSWWQNLNPLNMFVSQAHASPSPIPSNPKETTLEKPKKEKKWYDKLLEKPQWVKDMEEKVINAARTALGILFAKMFGSLILQGLRGAFDVFKFVFREMKEFLTAFLKNLKDYFKFIFKTLAFPLTFAFDIIEKLTRMGISSREEIQKIDQALSDTRDSFGSLSRDLITSTTAFKSFYDLRAGAKDSFYNSEGFLARTFGQDVDGIVKAITETSKTLDEMGNFAEVFTGIFKSADQMAILHRLVGSLGLEAEDVAYHSQEAVENNKHVLMYLGDILKERQKVAKINNIDEKRLSKFYNTLRKDITNFDSLSDKSLLNISAKFQRIGLDADNISEVINKFGSFEDAAKSAAMLSQTFGMYIDPLKLIETDDPMEIISMFEKGLKGIGRTFDSMNRHERKILADNTGLSMRNVKTLMMYRKQGYSMAAAQSKLEAEKPENKQIKALKDLTTALDSFKESINIRTFTSSFDAIQKSFMRLMTGIEGKQNVFNKLSRGMQKFGELIAKQDKHGKKLLGIASDQLQPVLKALVTKPEDLDEVLTELTGLVESFYKNNDQMKKEFLAKAKSNGLSKDVQKQYDEALAITNKDKREAEIEDLFIKHYYDKNSKRIKSLIDNVKNGGKAMGGLTQSFNFGLRQMGAIIKAIGSAAGPVNDFLFNQKDGLITVLTEGLSNYLNAKPGDKDYAKYKKKVDSLAAKANLSSQEILNVIEGIGELTGNMTARLIDLGFTVVKGIATKVWTEIMDPKSTLNQTVWHKLIKPLVNKVKDILLLALYSLINMISSIEHEPIPGLKIDTGNQIIKMLTLGMYSHEQNKKNLEEVKKRLKMGKKAPTKPAPASTAPATPKAKKPKASIPAPKTPTTPKTTKTPTTPKTTKTPTTPAIVKLKIDKKALRQTTSVLLPKSSADTTELVKKQKSNIKLANAYFKALENYYKEIGKPSATKDQVHKKTRAGALYSGKLLQHAIDAMVDDSARVTRKGTQTKIESAIKQKLNIKGSEVEYAKLKPKAKKAYNQVMGLQALIQSLDASYDAVLNIDKSGDISAKRLKGISGETSRLKNLGRKDKKGASALSDVLKRLFENASLTDKQKAEMYSTKADPKNTIDFDGQTFYKDLKMFDPTKGKLVRVFKDDGTPNTDFFMFNSSLPSNARERSANIVTGYGAYQRQRALELLEHLGASGPISLNEGVEVTPTRSSPLGPLNQEQQKMHASNNAGNQNNQSTPTQVVTNIWMDTVQVAKQVATVLPSVFASPDSPVISKDGRLVPRHQGFSGNSDLINSGTTMIS